MRSTRRNIFFLGLPIAAAAISIFVAAIEVLPASSEINFHDNFSTGKLEAWQFPFPDDWEVKEEGTSHFLHMIRNRQPLIPRRPQQFARITRINVGSFTLETRMRREGRSLLIAFDYIDTLHFYYAHLSVDSGAQADVHNGIFLVNGGARRRIAGIEAAPALPDKNWHKVRVERDVNSGSIKVFVDGEPQPRFFVVDHTLHCGQVGLGSFDETGDFADVKLSSKGGGCRP